MRSLLIAAFVLALLSGCAALDTDRASGSSPYSASAHPDLRPGESIRETDDVFPGGEWIDPDNYVWACRIVDSQTGEPIPGATVRVPNHVQGGAAPEDIYYDAEAVADEGGWIRMHEDEYEYWHDYVIADAPGYAPDEHCIPGTSVCELDRGVDVPFVLLDYIGEPVGNAYVGYLKGCFHIPDQRCAWTDDRGRGVMPCIDPDDYHDIYIQSERLHRGTVHFAGEWREGNPPVEIHVTSGVVVEGRVVDAEGRPIEEAFLGPRGGQRWELTDADGRFRLVGVEPWERMLVSFPPLYRDEHDIEFVAPPAGMPVEIVKHRSRLREVWLGVQCVDPEGGPASDVMVAAVRLSDGLATRGFADDDGKLELSLPPGRHRLYVDGNLGPFGETTHEVDVPDFHATVPDPTRLQPRMRGVTIPVPRNPVIRVDASRIPEGVVLGVTTATRFRRIDLPPLAPELDPERAGRTRDEILEVPVPATERATFRCTADFEERRITYQPVPDPKLQGDEPFVIEWVRVKQIRAKLVGPDGTPVQGHLHILRDRLRRLGYAVGADGTESECPVVTTTLEGTVDWVAEPAEPGYGLRCGTIHLEKDDTEIDLGVIRLPASDPNALRIRVPEGFDPESLGFGYPGIDFRSPGRGVENPEPSFRLEGDFVMTDASLFAAGDVVRFGHWGYVDGARVPLVGPPPWELDWPSAAVELAIQSGDGGATPHVSLLIDGHTDEWTKAGSWNDDDRYEPPPDGLYVYEGLTPGRHQLILTADGYRSTILELGITQGETRKIRVTMTPRPAR